MNCARRCNAFWVLPSAGNRTVTAEQQDFVKEIDQAGHHLLELINELLDLSRIEAAASIW